MSSSDPATQMLQYINDPDVNPITNPTTPTMGSITTPILSSPDTPRQPETPYANLQTPAGSIGASSRTRTSTVDEGIIYGESYMTDIHGVGLGYGDVGDKVRDVEAGDVRREETVSNSRKRRTSESSHEDIAIEFPDSVKLGEMQHRLEELDSLELGGSSIKDELVVMVRSLLTPVVNQLPFLHGQILAQRATIRTLQQQARLAEQLTTVERARHSAERAAWNAETRALLAAKDADTVAGTKGKKVLDLDVGYHQELEAANKRLEMDNRLMAPRLADTQRQIENLVTELRHLRPHVILASHPITETPSHPPNVYRPQNPSPVKSSSTYTMGDARAEHLLLAAKKVRSMRAQDERVGRLTLDELKKGGVVGPEGGLGYTEGYGDVDAEGEEENDYFDESEFEDEKPILGQDRRASAKGKNRIQPSTGSTPLLPRAKRISKRSLPPPTTPSRNRTQPPATTPGGSNFSDLLRAAEMAGRPGTPTPSGKRSNNISMSATSAARSTTRPREEGGDVDLGSPVKKHRRVTSSGVSWGAGGRRIRGMDLPEGEELVESSAASQLGYPNSHPTTSNSAHAEASALDLLAQASSLDYAQSDERSGPAQTATPATTLTSASRFEGLMTGEKDPNAPQSPRSSAGESALGPAISLRPSPPGSSQNLQDQQIDPLLSTLPRPEIATSTTSTPNPAHRQVEIVTPSRNVEFMPTSSDAEDVSPYGNMISPSPTAKQEYYDPLPGAFSSPTGATVPGLGKYVHLTSSMPARRVRSPYLKWTNEEDELLARAVAIHGEKWDLVSKGVPTRSYHQVRQRWLRKTGAFDKKPMISDLDTGMNGVGGDYMMTSFDDDGEETSPTPQSGLTPFSKKRKL